MCFITKPAIHGVTLTGILSTPCDVLTVFDFFQQV